MLINQFHFKILGWLGKKKGETGGRVNKPVNLPTKLEVDCLDAFFVEQRLSAMSDIRWSKLRVYIVYILLLLLIVTCKSKKPRKSNIPEKQRTFILTKEEQEIQFKLNQIHSISSKEHLQHTSLSNIYLINLKRRSDRLFSLKLHFSVLNLPYERVEGVDGPTIRDYSMFNEPVDYSNIHPNTSYPVRQLFEKEGRNYRFYGEFGCWQSHLQVYFHIAENGFKANSIAGVKDGPYLIVEDDIQFELSFSFYLSHVLNDLLPSDWELLVLGYHNLKCFDKKLQERVMKNNLIGNNGEGKEKENQEKKDGFLAVCSTAYFWCTHGYILRNSAVARKLIQYSNVPYAHSPDYSFIQKADNYWLPLFENGTIKAYGVLPQPLIFQDRKTYGSDIADSGKIKQGKMIYSTADVIQGIKDGKYKIN
jgi:GR25 family glycosyltransferase involved in LPS biosynthesis